MGLQSYVWETVSSRNFMSRGTGWASHLISEYWFLFASFTPVLSVIEVHFLSCKLGWTLLKDMPWSTAWRITCLKQWNVFDAIFKHRWYVTKIDCELFSHSGCLPDSLDVLSFLSSNALLFFILDECCFSRDIPARTGFHFVSWIQAPGTFTDAYVRKYPRSVVPWWAHRYPPNFDFINFY